MSDIDFTGSRVMSQILSACQRDHIVFGVARAGDHLRVMLGRSGLESRIGPGRFFPSVDEAVTTLSGTDVPPG